MNEQIEKAQKESTNLSSSFMRKNWEEVVRYAEPWFRKHSNPKNAKEKEFCIVNFKYYADALMELPDNFKIMQGLIMKIKLQATIKYDWMLREIRFSIYKQNEA
jgi:hypothetical protein